MKKGTPDQPRHSRPDALHKTERGLLRDRRYKVSYLSQPEVDSTCHLVATCCKTEMRVTRWSTPGGEQGGVEQLSGTERAQVILASQRQRKRISRGVNESSPNGDERGKMQGVTSIVRVTFEGVVGKKHGWRGGADRGCQTPPD